MGMFRELVDGYKAQVRVMTKGAEGLGLPKIVDRPVDRSPVLPDYLKGIVAEMEYLVSTRRFDEITVEAEKHYAVGRQHVPGRYDHDAVLAPLYNYANQTDNGVKACEAALKELAAWHQRQPENPFAAALHANALHSVGYAWRGYDVISEVTEDGIENLRSCTQTAVEVLEQSAEMHFDHWLWREVLFNLSISDYRGPEDQWRRFELAVELQPLSASLWKHFAYLLLPRWFGDFQQINDLALLAVERTSESLGLHLYFEIFRQTVKCEEEVRDVLFVPELMQLIADEHAASDSDQDKTTAASVYALMGQNDVALDLMKTMDTLYIDNWLSDERPEWLAALSDIERERHEKKAA